MNDIEIRDKMFYAFCATVAFVVVMIVLTVTNAQNRDLEAKAFKEGYERDTIVGHTSSHWRKVRENNEK